MKLFDLLEKDVPNETVSRYINYYFYEMVKIKKSSEISYQQFENGYISIMKDEIDRMLKGSGKLREKPWSNFLFYFMSKKAYIALFGTNQKCRRIDNIDNENNIYLTNYEEKTNHQTNNEIYCNAKNNFKFAKAIFENIKKEKSFLLVRSYVYITIIIYDNGDVSKSDFLTYYYNTNYKFTDTISKIGFINNVNNSYLIKDLNNELSIMSNNNKDIFDCVKAYINKIDYISITSNNLSKITDSLNEGENYILVEGSARTGKTIIAMSLLRDYTESNLLIMNYYFYLALKDAFQALNEKFPNNRIFHSSYGKSGYYDDKNYKMNFDFSIIDECQRLGAKFGLVDRMLSETHKRSIFLGDNLQRLNNNSDDGINYIEDTLRLNNKKLTVFKFSSSVGIPPEVLINIRYLLCDSTIPTPHFIGEYSLNLFNNKEDFFKEYKNDSHKSRHIATIQCPSKNFNNIGAFKAFPKELLGSNFQYFLNDEIIEKYYLSPFELISREVECMYVYIRDNINETNLKEFVYYQLYVLMTRGTIALNIYCENEDLKKIFSERIDKIKKYSSCVENSIDNCIKKGQFIVDELFLDEFVLKYDISTPKEKILERNITRLVHFTEESNIESIINNGILPRSTLENNGLNFDYNDEKRYEGKSFVCLSLENPNQCLLNKFKEKYPNKKYKLIIINPQILYCLFNSEDKIALVPRKYCNYNAASMSTKTSENDIDIMFTEKIQKYFWQYDYTRTFTRAGKKDNQPTCDQAEILFSGKIPPEYIESIEDI